MGYEVLDNFLILNEFFQSMYHPHGGFYQHPNYPAYQAVVSLICAMYHLYVSFLPVCLAIMTLADITAICNQCCVQSPECESYSAEQPSVQQAQRRKKPRSQPAHSHQPLGSKS